MRLKMFVGLRCKAAVILVRFYWNLIFLDRFSKSAHIKFNKNPSRGSRVVPYGQTDGRDEHNGRFSQFCERA
jgi:hypothetical protein